MKILFATDSDNPESKIAKRFGHAKFYLIYDDKTDTFEAIENPGHGEKHEVLYELAQNGIKIFIVGNIGPGAFETINEIGAEVYLARLMTVKEALKKYNEGILEKLNSPTLKQSFEKH